MKSGFLILACLALTACGASKSTSQDNVTEEEFINSQARDKTFELFTAECEKTLNCNPSVGAVVSKEGKNKLKYCTGFLVDEDILVTNAHCLNLENTRGSCSNIGIKLPKTNNFEAQSLACEKVLNLNSRPILYPDKFDSLDYAFLKIKKTNRPFLKVTDQGIGDNDEVKIWSMNFQKNEIKAKLKIQKCLAIQNSFITPSFNSNKSPIIQTSGCTIVPGNSGAPILNKKLEVVGLIFQYVELEKKEKLKPVGRGNNFSCIPYDFKSGQIKETEKECDLLGEEAEAKATSELLYKTNQLILKQVLTHIEAFYKKNSNYIFWSIAKSEPKTNQAGADELIFEPRCVDFSKLTKDKVKSLKVILPVIELQSNADEEFRRPKFIILTSQEAYTVRFGEGERTLIFTKDVSQTSKNSKGAYKIEVLNLPKQYPQCDAKSVTEEYLKATL